MQIFKDEDNSAEARLSQRLVADIVFTVLVVVRQHPRDSRPGSVSTATTWQSPRRAMQVLRKEVIQPQVPLRLPCYDFTPIIEQTVGGSLPCGLRHRLQVHPTFVV